MAGAESTIILFVYTDITIALLFEDILAGFRDPHYPLILLNKHVLKLYDFSNKCLRQLLVDFYFNFL